MGCSHPVCLDLMISHSGPRARWVLGFWGAALHSGVWAPSSGEGVGQGPDASIIQSWVLALGAEDWMYLTPNGTVPVDASSPRDPS